MNFNRPKVLRVVTNPECVIWHMGRTLEYLAKDFEVTVAGDDVSRYENVFPGVSWVDIKISRKIHLWQDLKALVALYCACRQIRPDIVHSIMPKAGFLAAIASRCANVPVRLHTFTGQVWDTKVGLHRWCLRQLDRFVVLLNTDCLTDSPSQSEHLFHHGIFHKGEPLPVLGKGSLIGVDLCRFNRNKISVRTQVSREALGLAQDDFVIIYLARKSVDKGAIDMLRAFALARKASSRIKLLFIGPDESGGMIEQMRSDEPTLFSGVIERGIVPHHEDYLAVSDILCMPSYREGFGSVVIDAAALGVPCICSHISGLVDSISDGKSGVLFPRGDIKTLSSLIVSFAMDHRRVRAMGEFGIKRVRDNFSTEVLYGHLRSFYQKCLLSKGRR